MTRRIGQLYIRRRSRYASARAAWADIHRRCPGLTAARYVIRPEHTARLYRWRIVRRR